MKRQLLTIGSAATALALAACSAGQTGPPTAHSVNPASNSALQFAVGTANIAGTAGLNVVSTFRQTNGTSAVLVSTPKITGPFTFPGGGAGAVPDGTYDASSTADVGPSVDEVTKGYIGGSPQIAASSAVASTPYTTFGTAGGDFGSGFAPANYQSNGAPFSYVPYTEPFYAGTDLRTSFVPWGGPPAFDPAGNGTGTLDGSFGGGVLGIAFGLNVFQGVTAGAGTYTLAVNVPTGGTGTNFTATATLASAVALPLMPTPIVTYDATNQNPSIAVTLPAGVVGAYVQVADIGPYDSAKGTFGGYCNGGTAHYYTFWVTASGSVTLTNAIGSAAPNGPPVCSAATNTASAGAATPADVLQVTAIGFDYNQYGLQYNGKLGTTYAETPALPAQADVTISPIVLSASDGQDLSTYTSLKRHAAVRATRH